MLRYMTSGESHGKGLTAILEGLPSGVSLRADDINRELARRQAGYGRGGRMQIEQDRVEILSGVRWGETIGSPIALFIKNRDWVNWEHVMSDDPEIKEEGRRVSRPRPGHADLSGGIKYGHHDLRNILERSSARETAARVAVGAAARRLLESFGIDLVSHVVEIGGVKGKGNGPLTVKKIRTLTEKTDIRCVDEKAAHAMRKRIDRAAGQGDTLGGVFEVIASGLPVGLGSHVHYDRKLNARLAGAVMSIQAVKGVEIGIGFDAARRLGSEVHDEIFYAKNKGFYRKTNRAGGIEGGMSNGEDIVIRAVMKPIPTLMKPLRSVDILSKRPFTAGVERSDVCAVPAAGVIAEAVVAFELARAMIEKFAGDSLFEMKRNFESYLKSVREY
ncbi:MAG: chorismate synthase [Nitrospirae bacterium CG08_land_8_20_14_0_20_52_24]|nr:MAG: chorismate synthase [Nitrospirae bacterium CG08_land_8_20_14_0_20_52_24]